MPLHACTIVHAVQQAGKATQTKYFQKCNYPGCHHPLTNLQDDPLTGNAQYPPTHRLYSPLLIPRMISSHSPSTHRSSNAQDDNAQLVFYYLLMPRMISSSPSSSFTNIQDEVIHTAFSQTLTDSSSVVQQLQRTAVQLCNCTICIWLSSAPSCLVRVIVQSKLASKQEVFPSPTESLSYPNKNTL